MRELLQSSSKLTSISCANWFSNNWLSETGRVLPFGWICSSMGVLSEWFSRLFKGH